MPNGGFTFTKEGSYPAELHSSILFLQDNKVKGGVDFLDRIVNISAIPSRKEGYFIEVPDSKGGFEVDNNGVIVEFAVLSDIRMAKQTSDGFERARKEMTSSPFPENAEEKAKVGAERLLLGQGIKKEEIGDVICRIEKVRIPSKYRSRKATYATVKIFSSGERKPLATVSFMAVKGEWLITSYTRERPVTTIAGLQDSKK